MNHCISIGTWDKSRQLIPWKSLTHYGLNSCKRPSPISDHLGLTLWVVAYGRFDCICKRNQDSKTVLEKTSQEGRNLYMHVYDMYCPIESQLTFCEMAIV